MDIVDALLSGQRRAQQAGRKSHSRPDTFGRGAAWVETMLVPSIHQATSALEAHGVTIRLDTNLDRKSLLPSNQTRYSWLSPAFTSEQQTSRRPKGSSSPTKPELILCHKHLSATGLTKARRLWPGR
jgi:hypothetical protein